MMLASRFLIRLNCEPRAAMRAVARVPNASPRTNTAPSTSARISTSTASALTDQTRTLCYYNGSGTVRQIITARKHLRSQDSRGRTFQGVHAPRNGSRNSSSLTALPPTATTMRLWGSAGRRPWRRGAVEMAAAAASATATTEAASGNGSLQRRTMSLSALSEQEYHSAADEALEEIHDAVEEALEDGFAEEFDCNMAQGVLNIVVGDRGTWVLNKQTPNRQIWWSSPISGPMRFEYHNDTKRWLNTRDGKTELRALLAIEMSEKCGVSI